MKRFVACLAVVACVAPSAMAATIDFGRPYEVNTGEIIEIPFTVVSSDGGAFTAFDMAIGSDTVAMIPYGDGPPTNDGSWAYSDAVLAILGEIEPPGLPSAAALDPDVPLANMANGIYPEGLWEIGANFLLGDPSPPFLLGTLTIDTIGLAMGEHYLYVGDQVRLSGPGDPLGRDGGYSKIAFSDGSYEPLRGTAVIYTGVPEPATVLLLVVGGLAAWRRRSRTRSSVYNGPTEPSG